MADQDDLLRKFRAEIDGMSPGDLGLLARQLQRYAGQPDAGMPGRLPSSANRELRRPRRDERVIYRIRVDLVGANPPIWRRLDLPSDLTLDVVHQVLQAAFGWEDRHLHRFSLGGDPFDWNSQHFLCPFDVEENEPNGIAASDVRLDETLQESDDMLRYVYDYGDNWELRLRLEKVRPDERGAPTARAVDGRRAAPPEDCGGQTDAESLAGVIDDPAYFSLDEVNEALNNPFFELREARVHPRLLELIDRLRPTAYADDLTRHILSPGAQSADLSDEARSEALRAVRWFVDRAVDGGIPLTAAGYLKPDDVSAAATVVPAMADWIGMNNREINAVPLLFFREALQKIGLLRKYKGTLRLTRGAAATQGDPARLWTWLADRLIPDAEGFERDATLLLLACAANPETSLPTDLVADAMSRLGWRADDAPVSSLAIHQLVALEVLQNIGNPPDRRGGDFQLSPEAAALARSALFGPS